MSDLKRAIVVKCTTCIGRRQPCGLRWLHRFRRPGAVHSGTIAPCYWHRL